MVFIAGPFEPGNELEGNEGCKSCVSVTFTLVARVRTRLCARPSPRPLGAINHQCDGIGSYESPDDDDEDVMSCVSPAKRLDAI